MEREETKIVVSIGGLFHAICFHLFTIGDEDGRPRMTHIYVRFRAVRENFRRLLVWLDNVQRLSQFSMPTIRFSCSVIRYGRLMYEANHPSPTRASIAVYPRPNDCHFWYTNIQLMNFYAFLGNLKNAHSTRKSALNPDSAQFPVDNGRQSSRSFI